MEKIDIYKLLAKVKVAYPFNYKAFTETEFELLAESWHEDLCEYPTELVNEAFKRARRVSKISITTADIVEQINTVQAAFRPSEQELWQEFIGCLKVAVYWHDRYEYTMLQENGKTQGENAREEICRLFSAMREEFRRYAGSESGLIKLARLDDEALEFERARFLKDINKKIEQSEMRQQYTAIEGMVKIKGLLEG